MLNTQQLLEMAYCFPYGHLVRCLWEFMCLSIPDSYETLSSSDNDEYDDDDDDGGDKEKRTSAAEVLCMQSPVSLIPDPIERRLPGEKVAVPTKRSDSSIACYTYSGSRGYLKIGYDSRRSPIVMPKKSRPSIFHPQFDEREHIRSELYQFVYKPRERLAWVYGPVIVD
ncbi:BnaC05g39840D [Brassica napus]|uniref:BnaC05g39840D protein n=1 Tax=Brassica napus TaxID=3708 RepID=A0A078GAZ8_BRANA|nr:BnaC05g39840D [Brassica napus]